MPSTQHRRAEGPKELAECLTAGHPTPNIEASGDRPELPGNVISSYIVPLDPAEKAGLRRHAPGNKEVMGRHTLRIWKLSQVR